LIIIIVINVTVSSFASARLKTQIHKLVAAHRNKYVGYLLSYYMQHALKFGHSENAEHCEDWSCSFQINRISKGGYFGELALVTHKPRAASAYAVGNIKLACEYKDRMYSA
jgi:CRP-like cAMP-binding protein